MSVRAFSPALLALGGLVTFAGLEACGGSSASVPGDAGGSDSTVTPGSDGSTDASNDRAAEDAVASDAGVDATGSDGAIDSGADSSLDEGGCTDAGFTQGGWPLCCPGNSCVPSSEACLGDVSFEGQSYEGGTCWSCLDSTGQPGDCSTCRAQGQPCCVITGLHHVCRVGFACPNDAIGGTCM